MPVIDPSTPAGVLTNSGGTPAAATTAAFSPPGNAILAAVTCATFGGSATPVYFFQVTDSSGGQLIWTIRTVSPAPTSTHAAFCQVATAKVPAGGLPGLTVTSTQAGGAGYGLPIALKLLVVTGAVETGGATLGSDVSGSAAGCLASFTPNNAGSLPVFGIFGGGNATAFTAAANNTLDYNIDTTPTNTSSIGMGHYSGTVSGGVITVGSSAPSMAGFGAYIAIYELPAAPPVVAGNQQSGRSDDKSYLKKLFYLLG